MQMWLLDSGLKLSNIIVILYSKLLDYILLKSGSISGILLYFIQGVNTKNVMYKNVCYVRMVHCMIKPRPDLESAHQAGCFDI